MISEKMLKLTKGNSVIRAMFEEGTRLAREFGAENVFDFSLGNPNFPSPDEVRDAILNIVSREEPIDVHGYMTNSGYPYVRKRIADSLNRRFDTAFTESNMIMTVGAAGGLNVVLKTLLNPGDEVVALAPYFVEYGNYVNNYDGRLVVVPPNAPEFEPDPEALRAAITSKTKAVILNSPNNPTGIVYSEAAIRALASVLEDESRKYGAPIYIISDEPYRELAYDGVRVPYITKFYKNTIVCYSWSKSLSLPGERIGYIVIPPVLDDYAEIFDAASIATRIMGFVNAPSLMQKVVAECVDITTDISPYDENRRLLYNNLVAYGYDCVFPQGAFYMWMKTPVDDVEFSNAAKKYNILVVPGASFACPGYVRIAYCVARRTIEGALPGLKKLAADFGLGV